jgi:ubiquitin carboxyl-terminal hydrolase 22/27/51
VHVACVKDKHWQVHARANNHIFALEINRLAIFCTSCNDYIYDERMNRAVELASIEAARRGIKRAPTVELETISQTAAQRHSIPELSDSQTAQHQHNNPSDDSKRYANTSGHGLDNQTPNGLRGMLNLGNTCFMTVTLQALLHNPVLRNYFLSDMHNHQSCPLQSVATNGTHTNAAGKPTKRVCLGCNMDELFMNTFDGSKTPFSPHKFLQSTWSFANHLAGYEQQDAHEFLISVLDGIHLSCGGSPRSCTCIVHRIFGGQLQSKIICGHCGHPSLTMDPIFDISLDLSAPLQVSGMANDALVAGAKSRRLTLASCLSGFTFSEQLGASGFRCTNCKQLGNAVKRLSIVSLPMVLCFHLKRFEHRIAGKRSNSTKLTQFVDFPLRDLRMDPYLPQHPAESVSDAPSSGRVPDGKLNDGTPDTAHGHKYLYDLFAVIQHMGRMDNGHYVCYIRRGTKWYLCDDTIVMEVPASRVAACEAYLLFYVLKQTKYLAP